MSFRSKFEKSVAASLSSRGFRYNYETVKLPWQKKQRITKEMRDLHDLSLDFESYTYHIYTLDFEIIRDDGSKLWVETKGRWTASDRTKIIELTKSGHDIKMLFMSNNKITPGSKTTYGDICDRHNIDWHVGTIVPGKWLKEN